MRREVRFYRTEAGQSPVEDFLDSLDGKQAQKVAWVLGLIEDMPAVSARYFAKLRDSDDLWEARIDFGGNTFRLLGFFDGSHVVVLTTGFQKKSRKTPKQHLLLAEKRKADYLRRKR